MTRAVELQDASNDAAAGCVTCEHAPRCPGCAQLSMTATARADAKHARAAHAFAPYVALRTLPIDRVRSDTVATGYRTRAKLVADAQGRLGLYARGTHDVVDIPSCRVLRPAIADVARALRTLIAEHPGRVLAVDLRELECDTERGVLVTLIGAPNQLRELEQLAHELAVRAPVLGIAIGARERNAPTVLGATPRVVLGPSAVRDRLKPTLPYSLAAHGSFVQAHRAQAAALSDRLVLGLQSALGPLRGKRILELHAGSGALSLRLCSLGACTIANERFEPALALAKQAAEQQAIHGLRCIAGDAAEVVRNLPQSERRFDAVLVNPPRRGLSPALRAQIAGLSPRLIAYVSCEPTTLARDLNHLALLGYRAGELEPCDMIPLSDAVECVALLAPASPPPIAVAFENDDWLAVEKPPHLATTPQGEQSISLLRRLEAQLGCSSLHAVHRLDQGSSGLCLIAKRAEVVAALAEALRQGEKQYVALARGITRDKGTVNRPLLDAGTQRDARTRYARAEVLSGHSLLRVRPDQGRKHQIRRHLASIGHPLLGDARYGDPASNRHAEARFGLDRPFLHLERIELVDPTGKRELSLTSELAPDLAVVSEKLRQGVHGGAVHW